MPLLLILHPLDWFLLSDSWKQELIFVVLILRPDISNVSFPAVKIASLFPVIALRMFPFGFFF